MDLTPTVHRPRTFNKLYKWGILLFINNNNAEFLPVRKRVPVWWILLSTRFRTVKVWPLKGPDVLFSTWQDPGAPKGLESSYPRHPVDGPTQFSFPKPTSPTLSLLSVFVSGAVPDTSKRLCSWIHHEACIVSFTTTNFLSGLNFGTNLNILIIFFCGPSCSHLLLHFGVLTQHPPGTHVSRLL